MSSIAVRVSNFSRAKYEMWLDSLSGDPEDADQLLRAVYLPAIARSAIGRQAMQTGRGIKCSGPANTTFLVTVRGKRHWMTPWRRNIEVLILDVIPAGERARD